MKNSENIKNEFKKIKSQCKIIFSMYFPFRSYIYFIANFFLIIFKIPILIIQIILIIINFFIPIWSFIGMILWRFWLYFWAFIVFIGLWDLWYNDIIRLFAFIGTIILNLFLYEKTKHFQAKMIKLSLDVDFTIKQNKKVIEWWKYEKTSNIFIKILYLWNFIEIQNDELLKEIQKKRKFIF